MRRLLGAAAGALLALAVTAPPASAATLATVHGTLEIGCFGCDSYGPAGNDASFTVVGTLDGETGVLRGSASFTVEAPRTLCAVSWSMTGTMTAGSMASRAFSASFTGQMGVVSIDGGITAVVAAVTRSDAKSACGGPVTMSFVAELEGA